MHIRPVPVAIKLQSPYNKSLTNCLLNKEAAIALVMTEINLASAVYRRAQPPGFEVLCII